LKGWGDNTQKKITMKKEKPMSEVTSHLTNREGQGVGLLSHYYEGKIEAGCDEAGRGCLAGSVYAAAVILPDGYQNELLNDSKQLTEKRRYALRETIERDAVAWAVGIVTPEEIDKINILNASILAMHRALDQLRVRPEAIIVDGNRFKPYRPVVNGSAVNIPYTTIVKGDGKYLSIAAASILAKTYRDDYMNQLAEEYPQYDWRSNKGYPTKKHRDAIREYGITPYHRKSYNLLGDGQLSFDF
jgi:ribonuclease HII